jgi:hypothetical protein
MVVLLVMELINKLLHIQEPLSNNFRANNIMLGISSEVSLRAPGKDVGSDDELGFDEEPDDATEFDVLDTDAMEGGNGNDSLTQTPKKGKGKKGGTKPIGVKLDKVLAWSRKKFLTTSEVRTFIILIRSFDEECFLSRSLSLRDGELEMGPSLGNGLDAVVRPYGISLDNGFVAR